MPHLAGYLHYGMVARTDHPELDKKVEALFGVLCADSTLRISVVSSLDSVCAICDKYSKEEKEANCMLKGSHQDNDWIHLLGLNKRRTYSQRKFLNIIRAVPKRYRLHD